MRSDQLRGRTVVLLRFLPAGVDLRTLVFSITTLQRIGGAIGSMRSCDIGGFSAVWGFFYIFAVRPLLSAFCVYERAIVAYMACRLWQLYAVRRSTRTHIHTSCSGVACTSIHRGS